MYYEVGKRILLYVNYCSREGAVTTVELNNAALNKSLFLMDLYTKKNHGFIEQGICIRKYIRDNMDLKYVLYIETSL